MSNQATKDPAEVIEMRQALHEFGSVVRNARTHHLPPPHLTLVSSQVRARPRDREDETTKKMGTH